MQSVSEEFNCFVTSSAIIIKKNFVDVHFYQHMRTGVIYEVLAEDSLAGCFDL